MTTCFTTTCFTTVESPIGDLLLAADDAPDGGLTALLLPGATPAAGWRRNDGHPVLSAARAQLAEYFSGDRTQFDLPLRPRGSAFQLRVWEALLAIPYGETASYGEIAAAVGAPTAARAVGAANGQNPISIIVPCHRIIGANGSLTGYGGGLPAKQWLLGHEASHAGLFALG